MNGQPNTLVDENLEDLIKQVQGDINREMARILDRRRKFPKDVTPRVKNRFARKIANRRFKKLCS